MIYREFKGKSLSRLGFGLMRLPEKDGRIDEELTEKMIALAIENGVNYFDTAFPYHGGMSEVVAGKILAKYPRDSYYLATKFPGHQIADSYNAEEIFETQLRKCGTDYFDFYLLHNVYEKSLEVYSDKRWGIIDYLKKQREAGRIKHLGFSSHGRLDNLREFLDLYGDDMEFCQIQLNYLDWTLQGAKEKYDLLCKRGIPVWVMEPVRGGRLAKLGEVPEKIFASMREGASDASFAMRFLQRLDGVGVVISGMSSLEQVEDNLKTFAQADPLTDAETDKLFEIAEGMKNSLPCTACRYCTEQCPMELDIPTIIAAFNDVRFGLEGGLTAAMQMQALPKDKLPSACIGCGACAAMCPQNIDIPAAMTEFSAALEKLPDWEKISKIRGEEAKQFLQK